MGILKAVGLGTKILVNGSVALVSGTARTLEATAQVVDQLHKGNPRGASRALGNYIGDGMVAGASTLHAGDKLLANASQTDGTKSFMTPENVQRYKKVCYLRLS